MQHAIGYCLLLLLVYPTSASQRDVDKNLKTDFLSQSLSLTENWYGGEISILSAELSFCFSVHAPTYPDSLIRSKILTFYNFDAVLN